MEAYRKLERAAQLYREHGPLGMASVVAERFRRLTGRLTPEEAAWQARKTSTDLAFDRAAGVDTSGVQHLYGLSITGPNARFGVNHIASDPDDFARAIGSLDIDFAAFSFVDLGSGKARAVLMAARLPFKTVVGVEFAAELHAAACTNVATLESRFRSRIKLIHGDASQFDPPDGPLVVYLYHPFGPEIIGKVARRFLDDWRERPRPIFVVYVNPQHADDWLLAGWRKLGFGQSFAVFGPPGAGEGKRPKAQPTKN